MKQMNLPIKWVAELFRELFISSNFKILQCMLTKRDLNKNLKKIVI